MKKLLSILLVIAMAAAFFAGCGPAETTPPPTLEDMVLPEYKEGDIIEFSVYNAEDFQARWGVKAKELLLTKYQLKFGEAIPAVEQIDMSAKAYRELYTQQIVNLFTDPDTTPDFMPALRGSPTGENGVWRTIGHKYLLDFNPFLEEGQMLECYVDWVWGAEDSSLGLHNDAREYWESAKVALEVEGALYVLPRRESRPIDTFLGYAQENLKTLGLTLDTTPTTWDGFVDLLKQFKNASTGSGIIPLVAEESKASNILAFVASTYGLDFTEGFEWKQKNGEPLWTYYWDEYLEILKDVRDLAENDLIQKDTKAGGNNVILNYDFDPQGKTYLQNKAKSENAYKNAKAIAGYNTPSIFYQYASHGGFGLSDWEIAKNPVSQNGYEYALSGGTMFDAQNQKEKCGGYIAINKTNTELALRLVDYLRASCSDEGYVQYVWGDEGGWFADKWQDAGNYIKDENGKIHFWYEPRWGWEYEYDLFYEYDSRAEMFYGSNGPADFSPSNPTGTDNLADQYGVEGTGYYPSGIFGDKYVNMFADISNYPMRLTAYWEAYGSTWPGEGMSVGMPIADAQIANGKAHIYTGMFVDPVDRLGITEGRNMQNKIDTLSKLAKEFTVDFLSGKKTDTAWETYIHALNEAGYKDVYNFYKNTSYSYVDEYDESVSSQSDVNAKRGV